MPAWGRSGDRPRCLVRGEDGSVSPSPGVSVRASDPKSWSAFVAPDLAPIFADEPWLDQPPSPEAQASVLARLQSIKPAALAAALARLRPAAPSDRPPEPVAAGPQLTPKAFLLAVMQDPTVALDLRIEAAKALLPYFQR